MSLLRVINKHCSNKYQALGFCKKKHTYARLRGDIIQAFTFEISKTASICTVNFGIFPLCSPPPVFLDGGSYELNAFSTELSIYTSGWRFDSGSHDSMMDCAKSIAIAVDLYLIPFFDKCNDCKSALSEIIMLESRFEKNRKEILQLRCESDCAKSFENRSCFDSRKYHMALKSHNYDYAKLLLTEQIHYYESRMKEFNSPQSPKQPTIIYERFFSKLSICSEHFERLSNNDIAFFEKLLIKNESQTIQALSQYIPRLFCES